MHLIYKQLTLYINFYILRNNTFFYYAMTIYIPFIVFKSNSSNKYTVLFLKSLNKYSI